MSLSEGTIPCGQLFVCTPESWLYRQDVVQGVLATTPSPLLQDWLAWSLYEGDKWTRRPLDPCPERQSYVHFTAQKLNWKYNKLKDFDIYSLFLLMKELAEL